MVTKPRIVIMADIDGELAGCVLGPVLAPYT